MINNKIKILYGLEAADAGSLKHLTYLVTHLNKDLFEISVILSPKRSDRVNIDIAKMESHGAKVIRSPMERNIHLIKDLTALYYIYVHLIRNHYDVVHAHSSKAGVLFRISACLYSPLFLFSKQNRYSQEIF